MHLRLFALLVLVFTVVLGLSACHVAESGVSPKTLVQDNTNDPLDSILLKRWGHSCGLCHINGQGGAPRVGNIDEWQPRLAQSDGVMLQHTIEGYNNMPPLGYCMSCSRDDFVKLIRFMSGAPL